MPADNTRITVEGNGNVAAGPGGVAVGGDVHGSVTVVVYQGTPVTIPDSAAIAAHRAALRARLERSARERWGGMAVYIQEEGATLPIEASPYQQGRLGPRENLLAALHAADRLLVLGEPGAGKTVALERLAWEACSGSEPVLPVLIRLFQYAGTPLAEWVRATLQQTGYLRLDDDRALAAFLHAGAARCLFLFDGLNEVPPASRDRLVDEMARWQATYPRHPVIVTSRAQDELWRRLRGDVTRAVVIQPIADEQAQVYLVAHLPDKGAALYARLDERLRALARTPLLLWLIKEAGAAGEALPGNRGELYARFVSRLLRRDTERRMDVEIPEWLKQQALTTLAYHLSQQQRLACPRAEAVQVITTQLGERTETVLASCLRHGLLAGEETLWFAPHQTVQEHFAALALREQAEREWGQPCWKQLLLWRPHISALAADDWWGEVFVQLAGLLDRTQAERLAREVAQVNPWVAWWCVEEGQMVSAATRQAIAERSVRPLQSPQVADRRRAVVALAQLKSDRGVTPLLRAAGDNEAEVSGLAVQALVDMGDAVQPSVAAALRGADHGLGKAALRYLQAVPRSPLWLDATEARWSELSAGDRQCAVSTLAQMTTNERIVDLLFRAVGDDDTQVAELAVQELMRQDRKVRDCVADAWQSTNRQLWRAALRYLYAYSSDFDNPQWAQVPAAAWETVLGLSMVYVPPGPFLMGSDKTKDSQAKDNELPQHEVTLPGYWIGKTPVTVVQFKTFVQASGYSWGAVDKWQNGEEYPVVYVTWNDALAYCRWQSEQNSLQVTLPSEAEWEKAARGTDGLRYPWGNEPPEAGRCNFGGSEGNTTLPGRYSPAGDSPYGCVDLAGNVLEWTRSLYWKYPYLPGDGREGLITQGRRVLRGGAFYSESGCVRCAFRGSDLPNSCDKEIGFRVVVVSSFNDL